MGLGTVIDAMVTSNAIDRLVTEIIEFPMGDRIGKGGTEPFREPTGFRPFFVRSCSNKLGDVGFDKIDVGPSGISDACPVR